MKSELDYALEMLENPVRRRIIRRLSEEPNYPLQLAKELGLGQQLVAKHLSAMEEAGLVSSSMEESPKGPKRRTYLLRKSISVTLNVAPHLFSTRVLTFIASSQRNHNLGDRSTLTSEVDKPIKSGNNNMNYAVTNLLTEIDKRLEKLENQKSILLYIRHSLVNQTPRRIKSQHDGRTLDAKHMLSSTISNHNDNIKNVSKTLNLRESAILQIIKKLEEDIISAYLDNQM